MKNGLSWKRIRDALDDQYPSGKMPRSATVAYESLIERITALEDEMERLVLRVYDGVLV